MSDKAPFGTDTEDFRALLSDQRSEYQHIRNQSERVIRLILSLLALVGSFVSAKFLFSIELPKTVVTIPKKEFNKCLPSAFSAGSDATFHGLGTINSTIAFLLIGVALVLVMEMMWIGISILQMPRLRPFAEPDDAENPELMHGNYREWVQENQTRLTRSNKRLAAMYTKLLYGLGFIAVAGWLLIAVYLDLAVWLMVTDLLLLLVGLALFLYAIWHTWKVGVSVLDDDRTLRTELLTLNAGPLFLWAFITVDGYMVGKLFELLTFLSKYLFC